MNRELTPESVGPPSANYALAMVSEHPGTLLHTSGIGPVRADGSVPDDLGEQARVVWASLLALLSEAGLSVADVVSISTYVVVDPSPGGSPVGPGDRLARVMAARDEALAGHRCASTLVPVPALASPDWQLEIALVAAGP